MEKVRGFEVLDEFKDLIAIILISSTKLLEAVNINLKSFTSTNFAGRLLSYHYCLAKIMMLKISSQTNFM